MRLPEKWLERAMFYDEMIQHCLASQAERRDRNRVQRQYYMYGTGSEMQQNAVFNYIYPLIDQLCAFIFSTETTRFSAEFPGHVSPEEHAKGPAIAKAVHDEWLRSNGDIMFQLALKKGHVFGSSFLKLRAKTDEGLLTVEPFIIDPGDIGVLREDLPGLHRQEAFVHTYEITLSQLINELEECGHPNVHEIATQVSAYARAPRNAGSGMDRVITSASNPMIVGNLDFSLNVVDRYRPKVEAPTASMRELYIWDDALADYRVVTVAEPAMVIWDRPIKRMWTPHEVPFIQICPNPSDDYFYGIADCERLIGLQQMLNDRCSQIQHLLNLHARQPKAFSGFPGVVDEMAFATDSPGGYVQSDMPGAKVDMLAPELPDDLFKEVNRIVQMMEETVGISNVMQGKGETGVRSTGHASQLLRVGASRVKQRALVVEDDLENVATKYWEAIRRFSTKQIAEEAKDGVRFLPAQAPRDIQIKVDAHSNSPIFVEDNRQLVFDLLKMQIIDKSEALDLLDLPQRQYLKSRLEKVIQPALEAQAAAAAQAQQPKPPGRPRLVTPPGG
jgi:hypothetical protein